MYFNVVFVFVLIVCYKAVCDSDVTKCSRDLDVEIDKNSENYNNESVILNNKKIISVAEANSEELVKSEDLILTNKTKNVDILLSYFKDDITEKSLSEIWSKLTSLVKDNIEKEDRIEREAEVFKTVKNKTEVRVRAFELGDKSKISDSILSLPEDPKLEINKNESNLQKDIAEAIKKIQIKEYQRVMLRDESKKEATVPTVYGLYKLNITNAAEDLSSKISTNVTLIRSNSKQYLETNNKVATNINESETEKPKKGLQANYSTTNQTPTDTDTVNDVEIKLIHEAKSTITIDKELETTTTKISTPTIQITTTTKTINTKTTKLSTEITENPIKDANVVEKIQFKPMPPINQQNYIVTENVRDNEIDADFPLNFDYNIDYDNSTDYPIIDYVDLYKDTTNEYADIANIATTEDYVIEINDINDSGSEHNGTEFNEGKIQESEKFDNISAVYPWIAAIFIRSPASDQFNYFCDGAILSDTVIMTAARCIQYDESRPINVEDYIIILGKTSLQASGDGETIHKVKKITLHENFTTENVIRNDLAVLYLETPAVLSDSIQIASLDCDGEDYWDIAVTTSWAFTGELKSIIFEETKHRNCPLQDENGDTFCATFGAEVPLCPSYGGVHAASNPDHYWCLVGLRTADPTRRGLCVEKTVVYTTLDRYKDWIEMVLDE